MGDDIQQGQQGQQQPGAAQPVTPESTELVTPPPAEAQNTDSAGQTDHMIPKARFDEINKAKKEADKQLTAMQTQLAELQKREEERADAELSEVDRLKKNAEKLGVQLAETAPKLERLQRVEEVLQKHIEARKALLPETMRGIVPAFPDPVDTLAWLDTNAAVLQQPVPPQTNAGAVGDATPKNQRAITPEIAALARDLGIKPEDFVKYGQYDPKKEQ